MIARIRLPRKKASSGASHTGEISRILGDRNKAVGFCVPQTRNRSCGMTLDATKHWHSIAVAYCRDYLCRSLVLYPDRARTFSWPLFTPVINSQVENMSFCQFGLLKLFLSTVYTITASTSQVKPNSPVIFPDSNYSHTIIKHWKWRQGQ